jgi:Na+-translocating ferredoxin:NAD+ oxidoreductase subunit B
MTSPFFLGQAFIEPIDALLPQTQCTRCGYPDCRAYATAIAMGEASINQCPPGGHEGVVRLSALTGLPMAPLDPAHGSEGPMTVAVIDEAWCIGCTLCIKACPTDAIVGTHKRMHTVMAEHCTGCDLCLPVCPVDCIQMEAVSGERTGWAAWSEAQARHARQRYEARQRRLARTTQEKQTENLAKAEKKLADLPNQSKLTDPATLERKRALIEAALAKARQRQAQR